MKPGFKLFASIVLVLGFVYSIRPIKYSSDFRAYYLAGKKIMAKTLAMEITLPPELTAKTKYSPQDSLYDMADYLGYKYTPVVAYLFIPFAYLPLRMAEFFWMHFSLILFLISLYLIYYNFKEDFFSDNKKTFIFFSILTLLIISFIIRELKYLQVNFVTLFCLTAFLHFRKTKENLAAFFLAFSVCIKIFPIFLMIFLLVEKDYRLILKTLLFGLIMAVLPLISYRNLPNLIEEYWTYFSFMTNGQHLFPANADYNHISIDSFIVRFFMDRPFWKNYYTNILSLSPKATFLLIVSTKILFLALIISAQRTLKSLAVTARDQKLYYWVMMGLFANFFSLINPMAWKFVLIILIFSWSPILLYYFERLKFRSRDWILLMASILLLAFPTEFFHKTWRITHIAKFTFPLLGTICISFLLFYQSKKFFSKI